VPVTNWSFKLGKAAIFLSDLIAGNAVYLLRSGITARIFSFCEKAYWLVTNNTKAQHIRMNIINK
jgi:hypothetical protein